MATTVTKGTRGTKTPRRVYCRRWDSGDVRVPGEWRQQRESVRRLKKEGNSWNPWNSERRQWWESKPSMSSGSRRSLVSGTRSGRNPVRWDPTELPGHPLLWRECRRFEVWLLRRSWKRKGESKRDRPALLGTDSKELQRLRVEGGT